MYNHVVNLRYTYNMIRISKFELLSKDSDYDVIYTNMENIKSQFKLSKYMDIDVNKILTLIVSIQCEHNFIKILRLLNDMKKAIGYS